jgi:hypothetical protein
VIDALQKAMAGAPDPESPRFVLRTEDSRTKARPAEDDPDLAWPVQPFDPDVPASLVTPPEPEAADTDDDADGPPANALASAQDWDQCLREVVDALRVDGGTRVGDNLARVPVVSRLKVGGVCVQVIGDDAGLLTGVVVALAPEESGDPRLAQRAQLEQVLRWINAVSGDAIYEEVDAGADADDDDADAADDDGIS